MNRMIAFVVIIISAMVILSQCGNSDIWRLIFQPTALLIVIGGTLVATLFNFSPEIVHNALQSSVNVLQKKPDKRLKIINDIIQIAHYARHNTLFDLREIIDNIDDNFLRRGLQLAIDIENPQLLYDILGAEISYDEEQELIHSRVFEAMGGYAPTFGIVGAVLGLIQAMSYIQDPQVLGNGIATAFVATLYGVGIANLVFLPLAGYMKLKLREEVMFKEAILQGVISITMKESPTIVEEKLIAYLKYNNRKSLRYVATEQKV
ncbi:MAG: MotA/TolQ/ExbB proton channel family protein [Candidatus Gastranaerophilales bacterium]|nr:MotA/TolQ/ExbB proton channel family protein [Candidatus Gastranaerophilales bacterium]